MVTVLFVGGVLTVVVSTAALLAITEFHAGGDDRKAAEALGYAEAGVDRLMLELRRGSMTWGQIRTAGCESPALELPTGTLGNGTFDAELIVYDPSATDPASRFPPTACAARGDATEPNFFAITSTGEHPAAKRVVRQVVRIGPGDIVIGVYGDRIDVNGNGGVLQASLVTPGDVTGREKIGFSGLDPYYVLDDFYPGMGDAPIPSAIHAVGTIYFVGGGQTRQEHPPSPNCGANPRGTAGQSLWDGSGAGGPVAAGCPGQSGMPPTSLFTEEDLQRVAGEHTLPEQDYLALRNAAMSSGVYCAGDSGNRTCTVNGQARNISGNINDSDLAGVPRNFVAFFDLPSSNDPFSPQNTVKWDAYIGPCSDDPLVNRSVTLVVRNGSLSMQSGSTITGAVLLPEGAFDSQGTYETHGTVSAKQVRIRGGANLAMSECWVRNMPGPLLQIVPIHWSELDR